MTEAAESSAAVLHVAYGDELAAALREREPAATDIVVVREALRDGPLSPSPTEDRDAFVRVRAHHLATAHGADEQEALAQLSAAWERLATHTGDIVLHVDEAPCVDCATFAALALETLHRAGRGVARSRTGVAIARGDGEPVTLEAADVAAGAGAWRLLVAGDEAGLTLAATDLEGRGGLRGFPELPGLLVRRAQGDVPLDEVHP
jgi:hypothetical protein